MGRIIKQGIEVTDRGRGEINSAYGGLGMIVGIVMPPIWGRLFAMGQTPATDDLSLVPSKVPSSVAADAYHASAAAACDAAGLPAAWLGTPG